MTTITLAPLETLRIDTLNPDGDPGALSVRVAAEQVVITVDDAQGQTVFTINRRGTLGTCRLAHG